MLIQPSEIALVGRWEMEDGNPVADTTCDRIQTLMSEHLEEVTADASGWEILYRDPTDGRYWELSYPQGHLQGGGPPALNHIPEDQACAKYDMKDK